MATTLLSGLGSGAGDLHRRGGPPSDGEDTNVYISLSSVEQYRVVDREHQRINKRLLKESKENDKEACWT